MSALAILGNTKNAKNLKTGPRNAASVIRTGLNYMPFGLWTGPCSVTEATPKLQRVQFEPRGLAPAGSPTPEMVAGSLVKLKLQPNLYTIAKVVRCVNLVTSGAAG